MIVVYNVTENDDFSFGEGKQYKCNSQRSLALKEGDDKVTMDIKDALLSPFQPENSDDGGNFLLAYLAAFCLGVKNRISILFSQAKRKSTLHTIISFTARSSIVNHRCLSVIPPSQRAPYI